MYAVIETGGKQLRVEVGQEIFVEKLEVEADQEYVFDKVLLIGGEKNKVGKPYVKNATVKATVIKHGRSPKIIVFKYLPKKHYHKKNGHRQAYTKLTITDINVE